MVAANYVVAAACILAAFSVWVTPPRRKAGDTFRRVRVLENKKLGVLKVRTIDGDTIDVGAPHPRARWIYVFLTECPACKLAKDRMQAEMSNMRDDVIAVSPEPNDVLETYWRRGVGFTVGSLMQSPPQAMQQVPTRLCVQNGWVSAVFLGDVAAALVRHRSIDAKQTATCPH